MKSTKDKPKKLNLALKKKITEDWIQCLPGLTIRKPLALTRRVGPLLINISLQPIIEGEYYAPQFSVHNLSNNSEFLTAFLLEPLRAIRTNAPDAFKVRFHDQLYLEAITRMKSQAQLPLSGPVSLDDVMIAYKDYVMNNTYLELIELIESPALIASWAGEKERAHESLEWGCQVLTTWSDSFQKQQGGVSIWRARMMKLMSDPEKLRQTVREEVIKHKLFKIIYEDFSDCVYKGDS